MIDINSLEIFKTNRYYPSDIGNISDNAYLSIVVTNNCQCNCVYCINSETDKSLNLPIDKAIINIKKLVSKYNIKEAILLGGEPLLHPQLFELLKRLRKESGLQFIRLTTNGIKLKNNPEFIKKLVNKNFGIQGINISFHNEDFLTWEEFKEVCTFIKKYNSDIKIRMNTNIWKNNLDNLYDLIDHIENAYFVDEIRISNLILKDSFSVNSTNKNSNNIILTDSEYINIFNKLIDDYKDIYTIINNNNTLGFVRYVLIPCRVPIIINWNINSTVSEQVCENNYNERKINTFKCLVSGDISLSWNNNNIINLNNENKI
jgi:MoaA/NifB/PqqE/SkfB family radical SAM enzyme